MRTLILSLSLAAVTPPLAADPQTTQALIAAGVVMTPEHARAIDEAPPEQLLQVIAELVAAAPGKAALVAEVLITRQPEQAAAITRTLALAAPAQRNAIFIAALLAAPEQSALIAETLSELAPTAAGDEAPVFAALAGMPSGAESGTGGSSGDARLAASPN